VVGQFETRGQTDPSTRRKNGALGQIRLSPGFKLTHYLAGVYCEARTGDGSLPGKSF